MGIDTVSDRVSLRLKAVELSASAASVRAGFSDSFVRDIQRKAKKDVGALALRELARVLGTSVAYLVGETDDPTPSAPLRASDRNPRRWIVRANGGASFAVEDRPVIGISLEDDEGAEERYLMPEPIARVLRARLDRGLAEIEEHEAKQSSSLPSSA